MRGYWKVSITISALNALDVEAINMDAMLFNISVDVKCGLAFELNM